MKIKDINYVGEQLSLFNDYKCYCFEFFYKRKHYTFLVRVSFTLESSLKTQTKDEKEYITKVKELVINCLRTKRSIEEIISDRICLEPFYLFSEKTS